MLAFPSNAYDALAAAAQSLANVYATAARSVHCGASCSWTAFESAADCARRPLRDDAGRVHQPSPDRLLHCNPEIELIRTDSRGAGRQLPGVARVGRRPGGERQAGERGHARDGARRARERDVVACARVDVADAPSRRGQSREVAPGLDERHEKRDLASLEHAHRAEDVLLEVELARAGRRAHVVPADVVGTRDAAGLRLKADERDFVQPEPSGGHRAAAGAARLGPRRRSRQQRRRQSERGHCQRRTPATECRRMARHSRWRVPRLPRRPVPRRWSCAEPTARA